MAFSPKSTDQTAMDLSRHHAVGASQPVSAQPTSTHAGGVEYEPLAKSETVSITEIGHQHHELEPEVEGWLEKVEREQGIYLPKPLVHDDQVIMDNAAPQVEDDHIVLPLTYEEVQTGLHHKVTDSARWLAEWCLRLVKIFGTKVKYRQA